MSVTKDPKTKRFAELRFRSRKDVNKEIVVRPKITIDAEIEGDVAFLAGVTMTLNREGRVASEDPHTKTWNPMPAEFSRQPVTSVE